MYLDPQEIPSGDYDPQAADVAARALWTARSFARAQPWTVALTALALGFAIARTLRNLLARRSRKAVAALVDEDDRAFAMANEVFAPSPTPPEIAGESFTLQRNRPEANGA